MKFIDLESQQKKIRSKIDLAIKNVLDHGQYVNGPEIEILEDKLAGYVGVKHAIACSSGTDALMVSLMALDVKAGDEIITTPFTFAATAEAICLVGAIPVFVDIELHTFNIDPIKIREAISSKTVGIIPVNIFGAPADYNEINAIAEENDLFVIEDACQSFGAEYGNNKSGSLGNISCTSFFPTKPLSCYGDGGMCFTNNDLIEKRIREIINHGQTPNTKYNHHVVGITGRLDTIQAAILLEKFKIFEREIRLRQTIAYFYHSIIQNTVKPQWVLNGSKSVYAQYSVLAETFQHRKELQSRLANLSIPTAIYYPIPLHHQPAFSQYRELPVCEDICSRVFSLPMHPYLTMQDLHSVKEDLHD